MLHHHTVTMMVEPEEVQNRIHSEKMEEQLHNSEKMKIPQLELLDVCQVWAVAAKKVQYLFS